MNVRAALLVVAVGCLLVGCAQTKPPAERIAEIKALEVESLARLTLEGEVEYANDPDKKPGFKYCSIASQLADLGEFRRSIREATKALFLGRRDHDDYILSLAMRHLATAYSFAGHLERAEYYATQAIEHLDRAPYRMYDPEVRSQTGRQAVTNTAVQGILIPCRSHLNISGPGGFAGRPGDVE